jgi:hypothetical protein
VTPGFFNKNCFFKCCILCRYAAVLERKCEKLGCAGTHAELTRRIVRLPRVLILHLKVGLYKLNSV